MNRCTKQASRNREDVGGMEKGMKKDSFRAVYREWMGGMLGMAARVCTRAT
jgi:hypothetical protein